MRFFLVLKAVQAQLQRGSLLNPIKINDLV